MEWRGRGGGGEMERVETPDGRWRSEEQGVSWTVIEEKGGGLKVDRVYVKDVCL